MQTLIFVMGVIGACSLIQSAVGFAFGLFALPLLLMLTPLSLPQVVLLMVLTSALQRLLMVGHMHAHIPWRRAWPVLAAALLTLPAGLWLQYHLAGAERLIIRRCVGVLILAVLVIQWRRQSVPREGLARRWGFLTGSVSGVLSGLAGIGGPPIVIWLHAQRFSTATLRATISGVSLPLVPFQLGMMLAAFGTAVLPPLAWAPGLVAAVAAGHYAGMALGGRLPEVHLRRLATGLLVLICLGAILGRG